MESNCHRYGVAGRKNMAKPTPKARDSRTGQSVKKKNQTTGQLLKRKPCRLKNITLQKMKGNLKIQRKSI